MDASVASTGDKIDNNDYIICGCFSLVISSIYFFHNIRDTGIQVGRLIPPTYTLVAMLFWKRTAWCVADTVLEMYRSRLS